MAHEVYLLSGYPRVVGVNEPVDWPAQAESQETPEIKATPSGEQPISHDLRAGMVTHATPPLIEVKSG